MKYITLTFLSGLILSGALIGQTASYKNNLLNDADLQFLKQMTLDVMESSRIYPGQKVSNDFGGNLTGGVLIRPGGRDCYPSFWIRDYAMSLDCGFVRADEQKHMLILTASTQCDQTWITDPGSLVPLGAIADHVRIDDSKPVYFPGTYDYRNQGGKNWGMLPPYCDQFFFIHMAWHYVKNTGATAILSEEINGTRLIDRLEMAFRVPPARQDGVLVCTTDEFRGVDFGFRDVIYMTGNLCLPSLLKYRASLEMAELFEMTGRNDQSARYRFIANKLRDEIPKVFSDQRGMLLASTAKSGQPDVWSTALAVYFGILDGESMKKTCLFLRDAYQKGILSRNGNIRHILLSDDYNESTSWEISLAPKGSYQNGAYWGTPTGWVCHAIAQVDVNSARQLAREYIDDLREGDYRKGDKFGAPWECYNTDSGQNSVYLTTVTCPYSVFVQK